MLAVWLPADLLTRKIKLRSVHYFFETVRIRIRIKLSDPDPYLSEKSDPNPCQSEKPDLDPYQNGLDSQQYRV
jgi:hypothetical protein